MTKATYRIKGLLDLWFQRDIIVSEREAWQQAADIAFDSQAYGAIGNGSD